jgi:hypothetical protein
MRILQPTTIRATMTPNTIHTIITRMTLFAVLAIRAAITFHTLFTIVTRMAIRAVRTVVARVARCAI